MKTRVENRLGQIRKSRGVGASDLARRVHVSRQTIYAIEAGTYVPNTEVALNLARELEVTVDELFALQEAALESPESLAAEVLSAAARGQGTARADLPDRSRWVSVPVSASPYYMPEADGIIKRTGHRDAIGRRARPGRVSPRNEAAQKRLVSGRMRPGDRPSFSHGGEDQRRGDRLRRRCPANWPLTWLKEGKVHIAGSHLEDPKTGEFNLPFIRQAISRTETSAWSRLRVGRKAW